MNDSKRFWSKVNKSGDCWLWTASKRNKGYGAFVYVVDGEIVQGRAHRFSWELHFGPIPEGLCVLHKCDTPACVRPSHLFLGSKADNNRDMHEKGRSVPGGTHCGVGKYRRGKDHWNVKLTDAEVAELRADRATLSFSRLAAKYGISTTHAFRIVNRQRRVS